MEGLCATLLKQPANSYQEKHELTVNLMVKIDPAVYERPRNEHRFEPAPSIQITIVALSSDNRVIAVGDNSLRGASLPNGYTTYALQDDLDLPPMHTLERIEVLVFGDDGS